jgi:hypothetical protein
LAGKSFKYDSVYYVTIAKGSFDPISSTGTGISDQGLNFYGGISSPATLYFKISSNNPPNLTKISSDFQNANLGTLSTTFDQFGTAYYLIVDVNSANPVINSTTNDVVNPSNYIQPSAIKASGSFQITQVNTSQTSTFPASFTIGNDYDVYVFAKNDANPTPIPAAGVYSGFDAVNKVFLTAVTTGTQFAPTLQITDAGGGNASGTTQDNFPTYSICPDSYVTTSDPIIIGESNPWDFSAPYTQDFNIILPTGYQFDVANSSTPNVTLVGADFYNGAASASLNFISSTVLNVSYDNDDTEISGFISTTASSTAVTGSGTLFTTELAVNNTLVDSNGKLIGVIQSITDDTNLTLVSNAAQVVSFSTAYRQQNLSTDYIVITGLRVIGTKGSSGDYIQRFYGKNAFSSPTDDIAYIQLNSVTQYKFTNTFSTQNIFPAQAPAIVEAIPDNYVDPNNNGAVRLIPLITTSNDYNASDFSGTGVTNDLLTLSAVSKGAAFNITMDHTDPNGCISNVNRQYLVYDHRSPISSKLGTGFPGTQLAGTTQAIVNPNFGLSGSAGQAPSNPAQEIVFNELAGYTLLSLTADLPASEQKLNSQTPSASSQVISGSAWRTIVQSLPSVAPVIAGQPSYGQNDTWDYSKILNAAVTDPTLVNPYNSTNIATGAKFQATTTNGNIFWTGGSLGNVEFTGVYRSTADLSVYAPFRQDVELFVPAIPLIEVGSANQSSVDPNDAALNNNNTPSKYVNSYQYAAGYPGTSVFCEKGGVITLNGYPRALAGTSTGTFAIYDYKTYKFPGAITGTMSSATNSKAVAGSGTLFTTDLAVGTTLLDVNGTVIGVVQSITDDTHLTLTSNAALVVSNVVAYKSSTNATIANSSTPSIPSGFVDNGNGTMTLDPSNATIKHGYDDILVTYTYQDNNSPAVGVTYFILRVSPNPVAGFTVVSAIGSTNPASNFKSYCIGNSVSFDAGSNNSSIAASSTSNQNLISNFSWDFGDINSGPSNAATGTTAQHTYAQASTYTINLTLTSNWGCGSLPVTVTTPTVQATNVLFAGSTGSIQVGDIPVSGFTFKGNCVGDQINFTDVSKVAATGGQTIGSWAWNFNEAGSSSNTATVSAPQHQYATAGVYNVNLIVTSNLGCTNSITHPVSQLNLYKPTTANDYAPDFANGNPGWQAIALVGTNSSWNFGPANGKTNTAFNTTGSVWSTTPPGGGSYYALEQSALYSACLDLSGLPRPMISYDSYVDLLTGEGVVLEYSVDDANIQDPTKNWLVLGKFNNGVASGIDWYNASALPSIPGIGAFNPTGLGWTKNSTGAAAWIQPKHALDTVEYLSNKFSKANSTPTRAILRFALASLARSGAAGDGVAIANVRVGSRTRTILFENFITTDGGGNPALNATLQKEANYVESFNTINSVGTQLVNMNYHIGFLGNDPFNLDNPADPSARSLYYNISKVPYAFLDALHSPQFGPTGTDDLFSAWGQQAYNLQTLKLAKADFTTASGGAGTTAVPDPTDGSIKVDVNFVPQADLPVGTVLHVAVVEQQVTLAQLGVSSVPTGETQFYNVVKKMLPDATGTKFTTALPKGQAVVGGTFKWVPKYLYSTDLTVVVFLQDEVSKEIYQAEFFPMTAPSQVIAGIEPLAENIKLYPNPADQELTIELPSPVKDAMTLRLANQWGQYTNFSSFAEGEQKKTISTHDLAEGVYILQIGGGESAIRAKVVVLHK